MNHAKGDAMNHRPLSQSLARLSIEEIKERLEMSPLLGIDDTHGQDIDTCCSCKMPPPIDSPDSPDNPDR